MAAATLKQISDFFKIPGYTLKEFKKDWESLTDQDKTDLKEGIGNGTLTY